MNSEQIRIMIADDHKMVRESWKMLLQLQDNFEVIGECSSGTEAIQMCVSLKPDILLMDINMYPVNGFEATRIIMENSPEIRIIGLSINNQAAYARKMLRLGAKGYVTKHSSTEEMITAILEVMKGNTYICKEIKNKMQDDVNDTEDKLHS